MRPATRDLLDRALAIAKEYRRDGLVLTVRQMYYQFVRRWPDLYPSSTKTYGRIKDALAEARYNGDFPIDMIEDRGREARPGRFFDYTIDVDDAEAAAVESVRSLKYHLRMDRWYGQPNHVSVWFEKDALSGVFETPCNDLGVSWFACKGYPSVSALRDYLATVEEARTASLGAIERAVVVYFGDHDPDGLEIPHAALRGIERLRSTLGTCAGVEFEFRRVALTVDQIREHNAPPFPAKESSSRFAAYREATGLDDAWELDALEPRTLRALVKSSVDPLFDDAVHQKMAEPIQDAREELEFRMSASSWMRKALVGGWS